MVIISADWGNIPIELATTIVEYAEFYEDFETFRFVSSRWRAAAKQAKFRGSVARPWVLLREDDNSLSRRRLYSFYNCKIRHFDLPSSLCSNLLSSRGWLLSVSENLSEYISLFHPMTDTVIKFPMSWHYDQLELISRADPFSFIPLNRTKMLQRFVLSANPSTTSNFTIAISVADISPGYHTLYNVIVFLSSDNNSNTWAPVSGHTVDNLGGRCYRYYVDVCFYRGQFYAIDGSGEVLQFHLGHENSRASSVGHWVYRESTRHWPELCILNYYLIELDGQLHRVTRVLKSAYFGAVEYNTSAFEILKLNLDDKTVTEVHDLGTRSIFVGPNSSFSVDVTSTTTYGFKPNSVYYTDKFNYSGKRAKRPDIGVYNIKNRRIETFFDRAYMWVESPILNQ